VKTPSGLRLSPMNDVIPAGATFVGLVGELLDLVADSNVSRIEVVLGSYELDDQGKRKIVNGKESVTTRALAIGKIGTDVQEALRRELDAGPVSLIMILWVDRGSPASPFGVARFVSTGRKLGGLDTFDHVEKTVFADYVNRQVTKPL
jgi:hypothetical protein